jgi:hypothetical protein
MQLLVMVIIIQFAVIVWLALPRIKKHFEDSQSGSRFDN